MALIRLAFQTDGASLQASQIVGAPDWITTAQFNIAATTASSETIAPQDSPALVRALLNDRFNLKAHTELRPFPAYALVLAKRDGRLGPKIQPSTTDCPKRPRDAGPVPAPLADKRVCFTGIFRTGNISSGVLTLDGLARNLNSIGAADRIVVDRTGLTGKYEIDLRWAEDVRQPSDDPPLVTAIQEQLGLTLEPRTEQLPVMVLDHIERPSEN